LPDAIGTADIQKKQACAMSAACLAYHKSDQLMQLATLVSSKHRGVTLDDVREEFGVSHRTAQRMMRALEQQFPEIRTGNDGEGRKRWKVEEIAFKNLISINAEQLAALEMVPKIF
jgi:predicted DNA-binding transcriptional regulator YafY